MPLLKWKVFNEKIAQIFGRCRSRLPVHQQIDLIEDRGQIDRGYGGDDLFNQFVLAVEAQKNQADGDEAKFPDPEPVPMKLDDGANNRVALRSFPIQEHHGEQGIHDIKADDRDQEEEERRAVSVYITPFFSVGFSPHRFSAAQEGIPIQSNLLNFSPVLMNSSFLTFQGDILSRKILWKLRFHPGNSLIQSAVKFYLGRQTSGAN
jgi:hypothetical protein